MKTLLLNTAMAVFLISMFTNTLFGQKISNFGAKVGLNVATLRTVEDEDLPLNSKTGFIFGGFLTYNLSKYFALQPELLYTQKGVESEAVEQGIKVNVSINLNYLEVPLLAKLTIPSQGSIKPNFFAGPAVAFKLSSKVKAKSMGVSAETDVEGFKSTDFGLVFGGGADLDMGQGVLTLDARYTLGLTNIDDSGVDETTKNGVFSLMVGYAINGDVLKSATGPKVKDGSTIGAGFGIPYGGLGIGGEYVVAENLNASAGIGTTVLAGAGYSIGVKYYLKDAKKTWRPRVAAYYGTNSVLQTGRFGSEEKSYSGLAFGIGQRWMWGASKRHGFDLDLLYIVTSGAFDRADELEAEGNQVSGTGRVKISLGYRYGF